MPRAVWLADGMYGFSIISAVPRNEFHCSSTAAREVAFRDCQRAQAGRLNGCVLDDDQVSHAASPVRRIGGRRMSNDGSVRIPGEAKPLITHEAGFFLSGVGIGCAENGV